LTKDSDRSIGARESERRHHTNQRTLPSSGSIPQHHKRKQNIHARHESVRPKRRFLSPGTLWFYPPFDISPYSYYYHNNDMGSHHHDFSRTLPGCRGSRNSDLADRGFGKEGSDDVGVLDESLSRELDLFCCDASFGRCVFPSTESEGCFGRLLQFGE